MRLSSDIRARLKRAKTISSGADLNDSQVTLTLYSADIDIPKLTALLGCAPTHSQAKGQLRRPPHGRGPAPIGIWSLEAPKGLRFEAKIRYLLDATPSTVSTWRGLAKTHDMELRCGIFMHAWNEGFDLPAQTVAQLGSRRWKFGVSIYSAEGDEIVEAFLSNPLRKRGR
jgi:hypothetical protein